MVEIDVPLALDVTVTPDTLSVDLSDGRTISVPLAWYPRLQHATSAERKKWRLIGKGQGIHWPDIDEDISVEGLLAGRPSGESQTSFEKWLLKQQSRRSGRRTGPSTPEDNMAENNPRLKRAFLGIVENQLKGGDPPETEETLRRLVAEGISEEDAKIYIAQAVCVEVSGRHDKHEAVQPRGASSGI